MSDTTNTIQNYTPFLRVLNFGKSIDYQLNIGLTNIGVGNSNEIAIDDPSISQIQSSLYFDGYTFSFFDLSETNKTFLKHELDNESILLQTNTPYEIKNGSKISLSKDSELHLIFLNNK